MPTNSGKRLSISETSALIGVPTYVLRQWEERFPQLRPKRDRANRRRYTGDDVAIARRIKELLRQEGMTTHGARARLEQEFRGGRIPASKEEARALLDEIQADIRAVLDKLDNT
ncbi:MAG: MerR family transcriptional regulator [Candidatus Hydrogenedentota bacterium]